MLEASIMLYSFGWVGWQDGGGPWDFSDSPRGQIPLPLFGFDRDRDLASGLSNTKLCRNQSLLKLAFLRLWLNSVSVARCGQNKSSRAGQRNVYILSTLGRVNVKSIFGPDREKGILSQSTRGERSRECCFMSIDIGQNTSPTIPWVQKKYTLLMIRGISGKSVTEKCYVLLKT